MSRLLVSVLLLLPCVAAAQDPEAVVRKLFADFWNGAEVGSVEELMAPATMAHTPFLGEEGRTINPGQARAWRVRMAAQMPDLHYTLDSLWTSGDTVFVRGMAAFTHDRAVDTPWGRAFPTGERVEYPVDMAFRVKAGRVHEFWNRADGKALRRELGLR